MLVSILRLVHVRRPYTVARHVARATAARLYCCSTAAAAIENTQLATCSHVTLLPSRLSQLLLAAACCTLLAASCVLQLPLLSFVAAALLTLLELLVLQPPATGPLLLLRPRLPSEAPPRTWRCRFHPFCLLTNTDYY